MREGLIVIFRAGFPSCAVPPRSDTAVGAHFGNAGQGSENGPSEGEVIGQTEGGR
jgi:hypothetical protein